MCMICEVWDVPHEVAFGPEPPLRAELDPGAHLAAIQRLAEITLVNQARRGGESGATAMRSVLDATNTTTQLWKRRNDKLRAQLEDAQVTIRAMVGQPNPEDVRVPIDPPKGHRWTTSDPIPTDPQAYDGRLYCSTCMGREAEPTTSPRMVLASECLERAREAGR